ncbi:peptide-aspartate beta-dioxygenase [Aureococcus anophagefferens]|nr:peptide-aspartate beta-dioxygenase [Aureococcus anophagefferens]
MGVVVVEIAADTTLRVTLPASWDPAAASTRAKVLKAAVKAANKKRPAEAALALEACRLRRRVRRRVAAAPDDRRDDEASLLARCAAPGGGPFWRRLRVFIRRHGGDSRRAGALVARLAAGETVDRDVLDGSGARLGRQRSTAWLPRMKNTPTRDVTTADFAWLRASPPAGASWPEVGGAAGRVDGAGVAEHGASYAPEWRILGLFLDDEPSTHASRFPGTLALLKTSGAFAHAQEVFFARQPPRTGCAPHSDNRNFLLGAHVGLVAEGGAWIRAGTAPKHHWRPGEAFCFDGSFVHETWNPCESDRVVLIVRFWAPELDLLDRRALRDVLWAVQAYQSVKAADGDAAADAWAKKMLREPGT